MSIKKFLRNKQGFTLVEAVITVLLVFILVIGVVTLITAFGKYNADRILLTCLVEGASSGLEACRAKETITTIQCGSYTVNISLTGSCSPAKNSCNDIIARATIGNRSFSLQDKVCNFD